MFRRYALLDTLVWSGIIEVTYIFRDYSFQLSLVQYQYMIDALTLQAAYEPFTDCICLRSLIRGCDLKDPCSSLHRRK